MKNKWLAYRMLGGIIDGFKDLSHFSSGPQVHSETGQSTSRGQANNTEEEETCIQIYQMKQHTGDIKSVTSSYTVYVHQLLSGQVFQIHAVGQCNRSSDMTYLDKCTFISFITQTNPITVLQTVCNLLIRM